MELEGGTVTGKGSRNVGEKAEISRATKHALNGITVLRRSIRNRDTAAVVASSFLVATCSGVGGGWTARVWVADGQRLGGAAWPT